MRAFTLVVAAALIWQRALAGAGDDGPRRVFERSVVPVAETAGASGWHVVRRSLSEAELAEPLSFRISLQMRSLDELQSRLHSGQRVSQAEMEASYLPDKSDYDALVAWLGQKGLKVVLADRNHTTAYVRAPAASVAAALGVTFARVGRGDAEVTSAISPPSLPAAISGRVLSISGLQPHRRPSRIGTVRPTAQLIAGGSGSSYYVTPTDIAAAYDFPSSLDGSGQTIAVVEDAVSPTSEFSTFWSIIGSRQSAGRVTYINTSQGSLPNATADEPETAVDVEWAGALAPGSAIRVYVDADIMTAVGNVLNDAATVPSMTVLSISFGGREADVYDPSYTQTFAQLAAAGITVFAASGENFNFPGYSVEPGIDYPASDPNVTGVGGTEVTFTMAGAYWGETYFASSGTFEGYTAVGYLSGGYTVNGVSGPSSLFAVPSWQAPALATAQASGVAWLPFGTIPGRWEPDVAAFAVGQDTDLTQYYALAYDSSGRDPVFGSSISAPIWASVAALVNQQRSRLGMPAVGGWNPLVYTTFNLNALNLPPPIFLFNDAKHYADGVGLGRPDVGELVLCMANQFYAYVDQWSAALPAGGSTTLTAHATTPGTQFQWQVNPGSGWTNLSDGTNTALSSGYVGSGTPSLTVLAMTGYPGGYQYRALATSALGVTAPTGSVTVAVGTLPTGSVAQGPPSTPVQPGTPLSLSVNGSVDGTPLNARFQWELNGVAIPGATSSTYMKSAAPSDQGTYSVVVSNPANPSLSITVNVGFVAIVLPGAVYHVSALAGGTTGFSDGQGAAAKFNGPEGLAVDQAGNVYVADTYNHAIRKISPSGLTSTIAGTGVAGILNGAGTVAMFNQPWSVAVNAAGVVYVADTGNAMIRSISPGGTVATLAGGNPGYADGPGTVAEFNRPISVAIDPSGNVLVADIQNYALRRVTPSGQVTTLVASAYVGARIACGQSGVIYWATGVPSIYSFTPGSQFSLYFKSQGSTIGPGEVETFADFTGLAVGPQNQLFVSDDLVGVRTISATTGLASNLTTDTGGVLFYPIYGVACNASGNVYYIQETLGGAPTIYVASPVVSVASPAPASQITAGTPVQMTVSAVAAAGTSTYQWQKNGVNIPGATSATFTLPNPGVGDKGVYSVVWTGGTGSAILGAGTLDVAPSDARLSNISARAQVGTGGNVLISGFAVGGDSQSTPKNVIVTGKGPYLATLGVTGTLPNPVLTLYDGQSKPIATDTGWGNAPLKSTGSGASPQVSQVSIAGVTATLSMETSGGAPAPASADSMLLTAVPAGQYTSIVSDVNGASGVGLTEVYDSDVVMGNGVNTARLANLSARAFIGPGNQVLIAGFVVANGPSGAPETIMIRGQGPNLVNYGLVGILTQPTITLYDQNSRPIASNSGWQNQPAYATGSGTSPLASGGAGLQAASSSLQLAYAGNSLVPGSADAAMVVTLPAGAYTVVMSGAGSSTGVGLVELYEIR